MGMPAVWRAIISLILLACSASATADMITLRDTNVNPDVTQSGVPSSYDVIFAFHSTDTRDTWFANWQHYLLIDDGSSYDALSHDDLVTLGHGPFALHTNQHMRSDPDGATSIPTVAEAIELGGSGTIAMLDVDMIRDSRWFHFEAPLGNEDANLSYSVAIVPLPPGLLMGIVGLIGAAVWRRRLMA
jgi:hypothetical protein